MLALVLYAVYCVMLRRRPPVHPLSFLSAAMGLRSVMMLPFYLWEHAAGAHVQSGWATWTSIAYVAVFPSLIAHLLFNRGIELIGAGVAGHSIHLMPLFGSALAVLFLGERFERYHAVGLGLIGGGTLFASPGPARRQLGVLRPRVSPLRPV